MASEFEAPDIDFRVKLENQRTQNQPLANREIVIFEATPDLIETRNVNYKTIDPVHAPGQIAAYQSSNSRNFNISSVKLISRTSLEAAQNLRRLWLLRSWTMPQFGQSTLNDSQRLRREADNNYMKFRSQNPGSMNEEQLNAERQQVFGTYNQALGGRGTERRGEPPAVLLLSAYSNERRYGNMGHINRVPVVIQNISIPYPSDADYIPAAGSMVPMPTILTIDMTLMETHSANEYENFSLNDFKNGNLRGF